MFMLQHWILQCGTLSDLVSDILESNFDQLKEMSELRDTVEELTTHACANLLDKVVVAVSAMLS